MTKTLSANQSDTEFEGLRATFTHPEEVVRRQNLSFAAKRAILAAWASDRHSVIDVPTLRQLESGAIVTLESILSALKSLDSPSENESRPSRKNSSQRGTALLLRIRDIVARPRKQDDDDDDPPPCPAAARPPFVFEEVEMPCAA